MESTAELSFTDEPRLGELREVLWKIMRIDEESYNLLGDLYDFTRQSSWIDPRERSSDSLRDLIWSFLRSRKRVVRDTEVSEIYGVITRDWITSARFAYLMNHPESNELLSRPSSERLEKRIMRALIFTPRHLTPQWVRSLYEETLKRNEGDTLLTSLELTILAESDKLEKI